MTFLAIVQARADLLAFLKLNCPAQIAAVQTLAGFDPPLPLDFVTYFGAPQVAQPETPALYVIPSKLGFRGTQWRAAIDQQHEFDVCTQVGNQDEEIAMDQLLGLTVAVLNTIEQWILTNAAMAHGQQLLFGSEGPAEDVVQFQSRAIAETALFYAEAIIPVTVMQSEAP